MVKYLREFPKHNSAMKFVFSRYPSEVIDELHATLRHLGREVGFDGITPLVSRVVVLYVFFISGEFQET